MNILRDIADELKPLGSEIREQIAPTKPKSTPKSVEQLEKEPTGAPKQRETAPAGSADNNDLLKAMYGPSETKVEGVDQVENVDVVDMQKKQELQQSHTAHYYEPLVKRVEQERKEPEDDERAAERTDRLKMEDLQEKQKKEEEKKPIALDRAERSTEANRGTSG